MQKNPWWTNKKKAEEEENGKGVHEEDVVEEEEEEVRKEEEEEGRRSEKFIEMDMKWKMGEIHGDRDGDGKKDGEEFMKMKEESANRGNSGG